jgi:hypothetical protein
MHARLIACILLTACGGHAAKPVMGPVSGPFAISLGASGKTGLEARLHNVSDHSRTYLHESHLQACRLELVDASGNAVPSFDTRTIMKFDNTVYQHSFQTLEPGGKVLLHEVHFAEEEEGMYVAAWGPHRFESVPAGTYEATVSWTSKETAYLDEETRESHTVDGLWTGTVTSAAVTLVLP